MIAASNRFRLSSRFRLPPAAICALLLSIHAILLGWSAAWNSATFDEPAHLAAGVEYWRHGDFSIYSLSPPLIRLIGAAIPVLAGAKAPSPKPFASEPIVSRHWLYQNAFVYDNFDHFAEYLLLARLSLIPLSLLAAWVTYRWASLLYGPTAGLVACALYCFNPCVLAHASLMTTDAGCTATMVLAAYLWWRYCQAPSAWRFAAVCAALVAANLCKFTAVLLWPVILVMAVPMLASGGSVRLRKILAGGIGSFLVTFLAINALYGFHGTGQPMGSFDFQSSFMEHVQQKLPWHFPAPLPRDILLGMDAQKQDTQGGYPAFLFGELYRGSKWYYYPAALACKLPVSVMILGALAAATLLAGGLDRKSPGLPDELAFLEALLIFSVGVLLLSDVNIGTRYLLPAFPLAAIFISRLWARRSPPVAINPKRSTLRWVRNILLAVACIEPLLVAPRFLTYINLAAGGPSNGWRLLADSDFDWGQGLLDLRQWMDDNNVQRIWLAYYGLEDPAAYGVNYSSNPDDLDYAAVSASNLDGLANRMTINSHERIRIYIAFHNSLAKKPPVAVVGNTIFIYHRQDVLAAALEGNAP